MIKSKINTIGIIVETGRESWISRLINFFSRGSCSHVEFLLENDMTIGSREGRGIKIGSINDFKKPIKLIFWDHLENRPLILTKKQQIELNEFYVSTIGKEYDYRGIFGYLTNRAKYNEVEKYFCSEYVFVALNKIGLSPSNRKNGHFITPQDIRESLLFKEVINDNIS